MTTPETFSIEQGDDNEESNENGCKLKDSYTIRTRAIVIAGFIFICLALLEGVIVNKFSVCPKEAPNSSNESRLDLSDTILNEDDIPNSNNELHVDLIDSILNEDDAQNLSNESRLDLIDFILNENDEQNSSNEFNLHSNDSIVNKNDAQNSSNESRLHSNVSILNENDARNSSNEFQLHSNDSIVNKSDAQNSRNEFHLDSNDSIVNKSDAQNSSNESRLYSNVSILNENDAQNSSNESRLHSNISILNENDAQNSSNESRLHSNVSILNENDAQNSTNESRLHSNVSILDENDAQNSTNESRLHSNISILNENDAQNSSNESHLDLIDSILNENDEQNSSNESHLDLIDSILNENDTQYSSNESHFHSNDSILNKIDESSKHSDNNHSKTETFLVPPGLLAIKLSDKQQENDSNLRLPRSIIPIRYNISLIPFLNENNFTFNGTIKMTVKVVEDCNNVTFHLADMEIDIENIEIRQLKPSTKSLQISSLNYVVKKQFFEIYLKDQLKKGYVCEIFMTYIGFLRDDLRGFYRSSYSSGNKIRWLAATQFQPTDARRAFPCFDEPALKAKFIINIGRPKNMSSLSNMPQIRNRHPEVKNLPSYVWDNYEESLPMSTYLVAFTVTDFSNLTNENKNFTVWARPGAIESAKYALTIGPKILKFFENFFGIKFPLPKIDMIALPDFAAGAMENWGLITYRETAMLYDAKISTLINKFRVACVVSHELAHQWFGNLVTPSWWSDIWLNEGFASYIEYLGVDAAEPTWKSMDQFVVNEIQNVFTLDALTSSHKISIEVSNPDEINEIFDRISYAKGATIIRMMSHFLATSIFRDGLKNYLKALSYKSAEQNDLWNFLTAAAGIFGNATLFKEIMDTWTLQAGFPVVTVEKNSEKQLLDLRQDKFTYEKNNKTDDKLLWWIPITYTTSAECNFINTFPTHWIQKTRTLSIKDQRMDSAKDWYILNIQQTGYYRVNYDTRNWRLLIGYLRDKKKYRKIPPTMRAQLIDDAFNLARAGMLDYHLALDLSQYLRHEEDYIPWKAALQAFHFIDTMFIKDGEYFYFKQYFLKIISVLYMKLQFDDKKEQSLLKTFLHSEISTTVCHLDDIICIMHSLKEFRSWLKLPNPDAYNPIKPDLRSLVYCVGVQYGSDREWRFVYNRYVKTNISSEKEMLLSGLSCTRRAWLLNDFFKKALYDNEIRKQDIFRIFAAASVNPFGQSTAFSFLWNNWNKIKEHLGYSLFSLNEIIKYTVMRMNNRFELDELKNFIEKHHKNGGRSIDQVVEQVEKNTEWRDKYFDHIVKWLRKRLK